ncbi:fad dependent oxidoreductase [Chlorella sorokiniana]|uniref:Fad dependent oxidoreductase n=1 Tax=Chlorella sorokiniana TaxID=3076 RepID=A0A2P6TLF7_CHLSO|nr:fad dependent oxidoreductase [Chlorella sorokiniana]|eukprot:PRW45123.1 fad dependent oxidoreductase [Chlorella sorokiniana]
MLMTARSGSAAAAVAGCSAQRPRRPAGQHNALSRRNVARTRRQTSAPLAAGASAATAADAARKAGGSTDGSSDSLTQRMFRQMEQNQAAGAQALGAGGSTSYQALQRADAAWRDLRTRMVWGPRPQFVRETGQKLEAAPEYDVAVCGGTLGIFLACSLQLRGLRVAVVERGPLAGRAQEWNISKKEVEELVELGVLSQQDVEASISVEFNPVRVGFAGGSDLWTRDVLNLGVSPARLVAAARARFEEAGGVVLERTPLSGMVVHPNGVALQLADSNSGSSSNGAAAGAAQSQQQQQLTARLVLDAMGHASPVVQQVRWGQKPDGVCLVVGTCARGFDPAQNTTGDVIYTCTPSQPPAAAGSSGDAAAAAAAEAVNNCQLFWEAFPAGSGPADRTTYLFTYLDASPSRPSLEALLSEYWRRMPEYQGVKLEDLQMLRILFGWFPTYRDSPLAPRFARVLQVGDASGIQSPLSFGGFGALTRHLGRLTAAVAEALEANSLDARSLALINAYSPGLSGAWMLQRAMSIPADLRSYRTDFINRLLAGNFKAMEKLGEPTLKPFLQDVIQLGPLVRTMGQQMVMEPLLVPQILLRVGPAAMADWLLHLLGLAAYTFLDWDLKKYEPLVDKLPPKPRFIMRRTLENIKFGAGKDYRL